MAGFIAKLIFQRLFRETAANAHGTVDPVIESTPATRLSHTIISSLKGPPADPTIVQGRSKRKLRRALPPGLTESEQAALIKTKRRAYILDASLFSICGLRFGWSSVIGLIPVIGDFADVMLAMMVVKTAIGTLDPPAPASLKVQMMWNILIDFVVGLVPFLGDVVDAAYKANTKNAVLLERFLRERGKENLARQGHQPGQVTDWSLPEEWGAQVDAAGGIENIGHHDLETGYGAVGRTGGSRVGRSEYAPGPAGHRHQQQPMAPPPVAQQGGPQRSGSKLKKGQSGRR